MRLEAKKGDKFWVVDYRAEPNLYPAQRVSANSRKFRLNNVTYEKIDYGNNGYLTRPRELYNRPAGRAYPESDKAGADAYADSLRWESNRYLIYEAIANKTKEIDVKALKKIAKILEHCGIKI